MPAAGRTPLSTSSNQMNYVASDQLVMASGLIHRMPAGAFVESHRSVGGPRAAPHPTTKLDSFYRAKWRSGGTGGAVLNGPSS
jgi:hypothetical protein